MNRRRQPPYAFLFGKHPPPLQIVKDTILTPFCTDRGTMHAHDLPEIDFDREWWLVSRNAFSRIFINHGGAPPYPAGCGDDDDDDDEVRTQTPYERILRLFQPFYRKRRWAAYWDEFLSGARMFTYTDFHRFLRQLTEPHGLVWIKTINYIGTKEFPSFYVGFPCSSSELSEIE